MYSSQPIFAAALLATGLIGSLGVTWLFPLLAILVRRSPEDRLASGTLDLSPPLGMQLSSIEILIPAHDEEGAISNTLAAISQSAELAKNTWNGLSVRIRVGADACSDRTAAIARARGAEVLELNFREKWSTLQALVRDSKSDWVALVDADVDWEPGLLPGLLALNLDRSRLLGVAPAFGTSGHWKLEAHLKSLENGAGGPLSVHGATVFYDRLALQAAFTSLSATSWLNDDVSVPLYLRSHSPERSLFYWVPEKVLLREKARSGGNDFSVATEWQRRTRMLKGNLQVISHLLPSAARSSPAAALLFLRRVFRVLWAYWVAAFAAGAILAAAMTLQYPTLFVLLVFLQLLPLLIALAGLIRPRSVIMMTCAFGASLLAPLSLLRMCLSPGETRWR